MYRLSESLLVYFVLWLSSAFAQAAEEQPPNIQLWKSFQQEIKTLEEAAHRVNTLLSNAVPNQKDVTLDKKDNDRNPYENPVDVTVFASPDTLKNRVVIKTVESNEEIDEKKDEHADKEVVSSEAKPNSPSRLNFGSFFNSLGFFKSLPEPWWKGENVCIEQSEKEEKQNDKEEENQHFIIKGTGSFEHCKQTPGKYICTTVVSTPKSSKTVSTTYQCCEGFRREGNGCVQVTLKSAVEVLDSLECKDFASLLKSQTANTQLLAGLNATFFAPIDQAMQEHEYNYQEFNQVEAIVRQTRAVDEWDDVSPQMSKHYAAAKGKNIVLAHTTDSLLETDDFTNEMVVKSLYNESPLRINIYPGRKEPVVTVNCARILSEDNLATHARVHTIDRRLAPVTQTVMDVLSQSQFSQFKQFLVQENLVETITNSSAITVFAPNNGAWDRLSNDLKEKYSLGEMCIGKVLLNHILPLTLCAAPMSEGRIITSNLNGEMMRLTQNQDGQMVIDDEVNVVQEDVVTINGVVHVLEKVLIPKSAKTLREWLSSTNQSTWLALLDKAGLTEELDGQENITLLVPSEQALAQPSTRSLLDSLDTESLKQVLLYHVTERFLSCDVDKRATLNTRNGQILHVTMVNPYSLFTGMEPRAAVQCVLLGLADGQACHAVTHKVSRLLLPPNSTALSIVSENNKLSIFKKIIEGTTIENELAEKTDGFTLLAPNDDAFNNLDDDLLSKLLSDKKFADEVLRMHILKDQVCCTTVKSVPWPFTNSVTTVDNKKINVGRDRSNKVIFGNAATEECDLMGTDGIVQVINKVLLPETRHVKLGNVEFGTPEGTIMLFGI